MHDHGSLARRKLLWVLVLTGGFMTVEFTIGLYTGSLALLADAGHMLRDVVGLFTAWVASKLAQRPADESATYGHARYEILGGFANALLLLGLLAYIAIDGVRRLFQPEAIAPEALFVVGTLGLLVNLVGLWILQSEATNNLNFRGAYLEVFADALGSIGVLAAATIIALTGWVYADALVAFGIGAWILPRTITLLREALEILLERAPKGVDTAKLRSELLSIPGVEAVHDLHVWALSDRYPILTVHLVSQLPCRQYPELIESAREVARSHGIEHVTVQIEPTPLGDAPHEPSSAKG